MRPFILSSFLRKSELRDTAKQVRATAAEDLGDAGPRGFFENLLGLWDELSAPYEGLQAVFAGYYPIGDELDVRPAMLALDRLGITQSLPEVTKKDRPLRFRAWSPGEELEQGTLGTLHPLSTAPLMRPDIVLVPLLAFDSRGHRLGWGGGYYDRTLQLLRKTGKVTAVGVAYSAQHVDALPTDDYDQSVDWIITEKQATKIL